MPQYPLAPFNQSPQTLVTLTAASASGNTSNLTNLTHRGVQVVVDITAITGTSPTLTVTIQGVNPVSGAYYTLLASAALSATGVTMLTVYPGAAASADVAASQPLGLTWRVEYAISGTSPAVTGTISAAMLV